MMSRSRARAIDRRFDCETYRHWCIPSRTMLRWSWMKRSHILSNFIHLINIIQSVSHLIKKKLKRIETLLMTCRNRISNRNQSDVESKTGWNFLRCFSHTMNDVPLSETASFSLFLKTRFVMWTVSSKRISVANHMDLPRYITIWGQFGFPSRTWFSSCHPQRNKALSNKKLADCP